MLPSGRRAGGSRRGVRRRRGGFGSRGQHGAPLEVHRPVCARPDGGAEAAPDRAMVAGSARAATTCPPSPAKPGGPGRRRRTPRSPVSRAPWRCVPARRSCGAWACRARAVTTPCGTGAATSSASSVRIDPSGDRTRSGLSLSDPGRDAIRCCGTGRIGSRTGPGPPARAASAIARRPGSGERLEVVRPGADHLPAGDARSRPLQVRHQAVTIARAAWGARPVVAPGPP